MLRDQFQELLTYPESRWGTPASARWQSLLASLRNYVAPHKSFAIDRERKWELVSALQKSIRRGDKLIAIRLISAMDSMPDEYAYFWKRLCVTACEDVGPADDVLASFVVACASVFPPKKTGDKTYDVFCFLTEQMCALPTRSRVYCSYGVIEPAAINCTLPQVTAADEKIVSAIVEQRASVRAPKTPWEQWQRVNDWRADGLLQFVGLRLPFEMISVQKSIPPQKLLFDLPSYCYDMHTRTGLRVLRRLLLGAAGAEEVKELFGKNKVKIPHKALGEALFFVEGGRIRGELIYQPLSWLEQRVLANNFGLPADAWLRLQVLVEAALNEGVIDRIREEVLQAAYEQSATSSTSRNRE